MRILSAAQHRELDRATLRADGINSLELMERAAVAWTERFTTIFPASHREVVIVAGTGNNGGDGLAIARLLRLADRTVNIIHARVGSPSNDNLTNLQRAKATGVPVRVLNEGDDLPNIADGSLLIDALFGTGLSRPIEGYWAELIDHLNRMPVTRVAVDLPSGLSADERSVGAVFRADLTLSLGYPKLALFAPASSPFLGRWVLVGFRVHHAFVDGLPAAGTYEMLTGPTVSKLLKLRHANDHKGTFGHALLVAGAYGKMGAAVISARSVLRAGAGLVTTHVPRAGYEIMQITFPEAMCSIDDHRYHFTGIKGVDKYDAVGVGPGLGTDGSTAKGLHKLIEHYRKPMVIDADALNILAAKPEWLDQLPKNSLLTPHPKEFERLFGPAEDDFARWRVQSESAVRYGLVVLLKTGFTSIATPDGKLYFNTTGNPGMGTGGTGDALTGILTGLLAQGYYPTDAATLGVYLHGLAGDTAADELEQESLLAEDLVNSLGKAYKQLHALKQSQTTPGD